MSGQPPRSELYKRVVFALVAVPLVVAVVWGGGLGLALLLAMAAGFASWEFYRLAIGSGSEPLWGHGVLLSVAIPVLVHVRFATGWAPPVSIVMLAVIELLTVALWVRGADRKPLEVVGITILGVFYTGGMLSFGYALRYHRYAIAPIAGTLLVLLPLLITWGTDTSAMLIGKRFGRAKLMPRISPGKTVVGACAGVVAAVAISLIYVGVVLRPYARLTMGLTAAAAFGLAVSVAGQVGDLVESMLKRQANVKDSSALIPGHGGALDRMDSLLFALPVAFVLFDLLLMPTP